MIHLISYIHNTLGAENVQKGALGGRSCVSDTQAGFTGTARHEFPFLHCHFLDNAMHSSPPKKDASSSKLYS